MCYHFISRDELYFSLAHPKLFFCNSPRGYHRFQVMGMIEGILGLKFSIPGYFWVGKLGKYIFLGWLDLVGFLGGIQNNPKIHGSACVS